ncbi:bifunctional transcriptional activator/DNA repair enzyme AdaA [Lachnospiraceae bacterium]|nr:bifunctional transcriptional activator/DNA repair enzyme AdaA [Lachnospiraceae bacterium]
MREEYEIVKHAQMQDLNIFLVEMTYRSPHMHKEFEICMVLSGTITIYTSQETQNFEKGDLILFNPYQTHELHSLTEKSIILSIQAASGFCKRAYPEISRVKFEDVVLSMEKLECGEKGIHYLQKLLLEVSKIYLRKEDNYEFFCMSRLYEVFGILLSSQKWQIISEKERTERYNRGKRLKRITDYIEMHFMEKILLSDIADMENLSLYYLSHLFKETLGLSFQQYVALLRFERARKMVEQTNKSLTEISMECGFSDYRYLNKIYQKQLGYTPIEYRNSHMDHFPEKAEEDLTNMQRFYTEEDSLKILELAEDSMFIECSK